MWAHQVVMIVLMQVCSTVACSTWHPLQHVKTWSAKSGVWLTSYNTYESFLAKQMVVTGTGGIDGCHSNRNSIFGFSVRTIFVHPKSNFMQVKECFPRILIWWIRAAFTVDGRWPKHELQPSKMKWIEYFIFICRFWSLLRVRAVSTSFQFVA